MNILELKINPYKDENVVTLNNKPLSPYSELFNFIKEPFLNWAGNFLNTAEREINDDYELIVIGEEFETSFLNDMQNDFDACRNFTVKNFQIPISVEKRYYQIIKCLNENGLPFDNSGFRIKVYNETSLDLDEQFIVRSNIESAEICLLTDVNSIQNAMSSSIIILTTDVLSSDEKPFVKQITSGRYIWKIEAYRLNRIIKSIIDRFVKIPFIVQNVEKLKQISKENGINCSDNIALCTEIDTFITVKDIKKVEVGKSFQPELIIIPKSSNIPDVRIESSNPIVISANGTNLIANAPGNAVLSFYRPNELIPFTKKNVEVYKDNRAVSIKISVNNQFIGINQQFPVNTIVFPSDAEDVHNIVWKSSNNNIAAVDSNGVVTTYTAGKFILTASCSMCSDSLEIEVLPNITDIDISVKQCKLYVGQKQPIIVTVKPTNCYNSNYVWKTSDSDIAVVETLDDGSFAISATGIGNCLISCCAEEGNCQSNCNVLVESTFKKREKEKNGGGVAFALAILCFIFAFIPFKTAAIVTSVITVCFSLFLLFSVKKEKFWTLVSIVVAVFSILEATGIINVL